MSNIAIDKCLFYQSKILLTLWLLTKKKLGWKENSLNTSTIVNNIYMNSKKVP